jgi:hypothetical protein
VTPQSGQNRRGLPAHHARDVYTLSGFEVRTGILNVTELLGEGVQHEEIGLE